MQQANRLKLVKSGENSDIFIVYGIKTVYSMKGEDMKTLTVLMMSGIIIFNAAHTAAETNNLIEAAKEAYSDGASKEASGHAADNAEPALAQHEDLLQAETVSVVPEKTDSPSLDGVFDANTLGYMIRYPEGWVYETPTAHLVVFSGNKGSEAYYSTVSIHNIMTAREGGKYTDMSEVADGIVGQLNVGAAGVKIYDEKPFMYTMKDGRRIKGLELKAEYVKQDSAIKQWVVIIPRPSGEAFHVWSYTSPADTYDKYHSFARLMLDSWEIS